MDWPVMDMNKQATGKEYHEGEPVSDLDTKRVLIVAGPKDTVWIEGHGEMTVADREDPYYGPQIDLAPEDGWNRPPTMGGET